MSHTHSPEPRQEARKKLRIALTLTSLLFLAEILGGYWSNSLALLSDAGHMLGDLIALSLSLLSIYWATKGASVKKTYGYYRAEVLATMANGALLLFVALEIIVEAAGRLRSPEKVNLSVMLPVAVAGMLVNAVCAFLLRAHSDHLVTKSALYHVLSDFFSSVCVIVAGGVMAFTGWLWVDAPTSLLIAILILRNAFLLLREVFDILMEAAPHGIDPEAVRSALLEVAAIKDVHDLHVWTIGSGFLAASAHLSVPNMELRQADAILDEAKRLLHDRFRIAHATLQLSALPDPAKIQNLS